MQTRKLLQEFLFPMFLFLVATSIYLYPMFSGLMLLPLDLLVSNIAPWDMAGKILIKNPFMQDAVVQMYPWKAAAMSAIHAMRIPFWNPYELMGTPFMASIKPMVFYPFTLLLSALPSVAAWNSLLFLQIFLSLFFSYLLAREFNLNRIPSIFMAITFSLSSLMMAVLEFGSEGHVLLWIPLMLYFTKKYLDSQKPILLIGLGLSIAASMLAGHLQYFSYGFLALVGFIFWYGIHTKTHIKTYAILFLAIVLGVGISAMQILPFLELFKNSYRAGAIGNKLFTDALVTPFYFVRFLAPDFFGNPVARDEASNYIEYSGYFGSIALFFVGYAMVYVKKNTIADYFKILFFIALALSAKVIGNSLLLFHLPMLTSGSGSRMLSLVYLSGAILAGFGMQHFFEEHTKEKKGLAILTFAITMFAFLPAEMFGFNAFVGKVLHFSNLKFPSLFAAAYIVLLSIFVARPWKNKLVLFLIPLFIVALSFADLFRMGYRFLTYSNTKFLYPDAPITQFVKKVTQTNLSRVYGFTEPEISTILHIQSLESYNPLMLARSRIFLDTLLHTKSASNELTSKDTLATNDPHAKKRVFDMLGVSYVAAPVGTNPSVRYFGTAAFEGNFTPIYRDEKYVVFTNSSAYPRFQLFYDAMFVKTDTEALKKLDDKTIDLTKTLIVESAPITLREGSGSATLTSWQPEKITFSVNTNVPALFYLSDAMYPGWKVSVNGKEEKILTANYNFRAVLVPQGTSTVTFWYKSTSFKLGLGISVLSTIFLLLTGLLNRQKD